MPELEAEDFLELLWNGEGWVDMPAKVNGYWIPYPIDWPTTDGGTGLSRRIDRSLFDGEDLYFSVARFAERGRSIDQVLPVSWLWADLDEVHPSVATDMGLMPTIAVESSPGRYQAYWKLDREYRPSTIERLNRALTYALGADKGGWDLTQVLRIPSTRNFKYKGAPRVRIMFYEEGLIYKAAAVWAVVKAAVPAAELVGLSSVDLPKGSVPRKAQQLMWAKEDEVVEGERSDRLWELNCLLAESGRTEDEIYAMVNGTVWNKWRGMNSGAARLRGDIRKAIWHVRRKAAKKASAAAAPAPKETKEVREDEAKDDETPSRLRFVSYSSFMAMTMEEPKWLIENVWTAGSHGIIGGEPKTAKTTLAMAMGLSVASGRPFLGQFEVGTMGPVLMVQEENAPWMMQDRMRQLSVHMDLIPRESARLLGRASRGALGTEIHEVDLPEAFPFWLMNNCGFDLSMEEHRDFLEGYVAEAEPVLVILDPMYLIFGPIDANSMRDLQPFLKWVIHLRYKYDCAVALVHHMGKTNQNTVGRRAGQRLIGSATLHGFTDSALYTSLLEEPRDGWTKVLMERDFRSMQPQRPLEMAWHFGLPGSLDMQLEVASRDLGGLIAEIVGERTRVTVSMLAKETGSGERTIRRHIERSDLLKFSSRGQGKIQYVLRTGTNGASANSEH